MILGITGPSGAGKGTVSRMLAAHGFRHIDTDITAREIVPDTLSALVEKFGNIVDSNGQLDRAALAKKAFSSEKNTKALNRIMHGAIMDRVRKIIDEDVKKGNHNFVIDGAALFEARGNEICDYTIAVLCDEKTRLSRIITRDGISKERAEERFSRQLTDSFFRKNADFVIVNRDLADTKKQLYNILNIINKKKK